MVLWHALRPARGAGVPGGNHACWVPFRPSPCAMSCGLRPPRDRAPPVRRRDRATGRISGRSSPRSNCSGSWACDRQRPKPPRGFETRGRNGVAADSMMTQIKETGSGAARAGRPGQTCGRRDEDQICGFLLANAQARDFFSSLPGHVAPDRIQIRPRRLRPGHARARPRHAAGVPSAPRHVAGVPSASRHVPGVPSASRHVAGVPSARDAGAFCAPLGRAHALSSANRISDQTQHAPGPGARTCPDPVRSAAARP